MEPEEKNILEEYPKANNVRRINIILANFANFKEIMDGYEASLKFLIISERKAARQKNMGDLEVRVQTSGISDKTAATAIESVMLSNAIKNRTLDAELKDIDYPEQYRKEADTIWNMRDDFELIKAQIKTLPIIEAEVLIPYLNGTRNLFKLAEITDCSYEAVKTRLRKAKNHIRANTEIYLKRKYR